MIVELGTEEDLVVNNQEHRVYDFAKSARVN